VHLAGGTTLGFWAADENYPDQKIRNILLTNNANGHADALAERLYEFFTEFKLPIHFARRTGTRPDLFGVGSHPSSFGAAPLGRGRPV
jgi:hypothetical protein